MFVVFEEMLRGERNNRVIFRDMVICMTTGTLRVPENNCRNATLGVHSYRLS